MSALRAENLIDCARISHRQCGTVLGDGLQLVGQPMAVLPHQPNREQGLDFRRQGKVQDILTNKWHRAFAQFHERSCYTPRALRLGLDLSRLFLTDHGDQAMSQATDSPQQHPPAVDPAAFVRMVVWLLRTQAVLAVATSVAAAVLGGASAALAVIAGGGVGIVVTAVAALRVGAAPADAAAMAAAFYRGMATKLALAVLLFVVVAVWFAQWFMPVLAGYVATLVAYWVALIRVGRTAGGA